MPDALTPDIGDWGRLGPGGGSGGPISERLDCMVLPRDFWDRGAFGKVAEGGVGVSVRSSGEDTSPRLETPDSLPAVDCREGFEEVAVGVGEAGMARGTGACLSVAARE
jgi:hypothetical protein